MEAREVATLITLLTASIVRAASSIQSLLRAQTEDERDQIMAAHRKQSREQDSEIERLADEAQARIDARG